MTVVANRASTVIAPAKCSTVASGVLPTFTVNAPSSATRATATSAETAERSAPPRPPTPKSWRARYATSTSARDARISRAARYRCDTSITCVNWVKSGMMRP
jgi:hypothetical protein